MRASVWAAVVLAMSCYAGFAGAEKGLVAGWDFDEGKGSVVHDRSGNENHGVICGARWVELPKGFALRFDTLADLVYFGDRPSLNLAGPASVEAWIYPLSTPAGEVGFIGKSFTSYVMTFYKNGRCHWYIDSSTNNCSGPVQLNKWQHVAATFDGTLMTFYVNGQVAEQKTSKFEAPGQGREFLIGSIITDSRSYGDATAFKGMLDGVRVYDRGLSAAEVKARYQKHAPDYAMDAAWFATHKPRAAAPPKQPLAAHWDFDEGRGNVLHDRSGNKNHGKIHGAKWVKSGTGHALQFDGKDDYVDCGTGASLDITGPISMEAWICPLAVPQGEPGVAGKFYESYALTLYKSGCCYWYISSGANQVAVPVEVGAWQHIVGTFDGLGSRLYINGTQVKARKSDYRYVKPGKNFLMGCIIGDPTAQDSAYHATAHFEGIIDDVKVYNRTLSQKEIAMSYNRSAQERGLALVDASWFDRFRLTLYPYPAEDKLIVDVNYMGLLPVPAGAWIRTELRTPDAPKALASHTIRPRSVPGHDEVTFSLTGLAPATYQVRAVLADKEGARASETIRFTHPTPPLQVPSPKDKVVSALPPPLEPISYKFQLCESGGFKILIDRRAFPVESSFSFPQGGANTLVVTPAKGKRQCEASWEVLARKLGTKEYRVRAQGEYYAVERNIRLHPEHITVCDTITNLTDKDVGIILDNYVAADSKQFPTAYAGGVKGMSSRPALHNPTAFMARKDLGLGLVAIDDVYVTQGKVYRDPTRCGISDDMFGLAPKASYTMKWNIYLKRSDDYFDFINAVRDDLGLSGRTVKANFMFMPRRTPPSQHSMDVLRPKYVSIGCLSKCADDPGISIEGVEFIDFPKERALIRKTVAETRKKYPDVYLMFHIAHSLYATNKPERYADSRVIDENGKQVVYSKNRTYLENYFSKKNLDAGWDWWIFYPTRDNSMGKTMLHAVDVMMDEMGVTGVWADGLMAIFSANFTYDRWDGHTVEIDPKTNTIKRKFASLHLLSQDLIMDYCKKITAKGGVVVCDSGPGTLTFAREAAVAAYPVESGNDMECRKTHLAPFPMALGYPNFKPEPKVYNDMLDKLRWGVLYYYYHGPLDRAGLLARMYPITIQEIHSGFVKGRERLVTADAGAYGWLADKDLHVVQLCDGRGRLVPHRFLTTVDRSGVRTDLALKENEMAVLQKIPVTMRAPRPVNLVCRQYDDKTVEIVLNGSGKPAMPLAGKLSMEVRDGEFPIEPGAAYRVEAHEERTVIAKRDGTLAFSLRAEGELILRIKRVTQEK